MPDEADSIYLNGIDGTTGQYLVAPMDPKAAVASARGVPADEEKKGWLAKIRSMLSKPFRALPFDVDPRLASQAGWAIVFAAETPQVIRDALRPLIDLRRSQVPEDRCLVLDHRPGERMKDWLRRHGVYPGSVAPTKVPYYVLLVGDPTQLPFEFQCLLDVEYSVGRICFDSADEYRQYASSVVAYESAGSLSQAREVAWWGPRHSADRATHMSADGLIKPLHEGIPAEGSRPPEGPIAPSLGFRSRCMLAREATRDALAGLLHARDGERPAVVMTASHGMGWPLGDTRQLPETGALLTQDWGGFGEVKREHYLAADDLGEDARVHGLIALVFACYGLGSPAFDPYLTDRRKGPVAVAERPFVSALPRRLLGHPGGGALAVVGHVERAWGYSIKPPGLGPQIVPFRNFVGRVLSGEPVGHATKDFSEKYAVLSAELLDLLDETRPGPRPTDDQLARIWIERNDAQNYALLGDPAVRLRVDLLS